MHFPTFRADTYFLSSQTYVSALNGDIELSDKTLVRNVGERPMVEIVTESGLCLHLAAETMFSLEKTGGTVVRYIPYGFYTPPTSKDRDWWRYALAGAVCASGRHSFERNRPSNMRVPTAFASMIQSVLEERHDEMQRLGLLAPNYQSSVKAQEDENGRVFIKGRALSNLVGDILEPKTQFPRAMSVSERRAFMTGLISSLADEDGAIFRHCHADVVEMVHLWLWRDFGIPAELVINPWESRVTAFTSGLMPHSVRLNADAVQIACLTGLRLADIPKYHYPEMLLPERIKRVTQAGVCRAVEVIAASPQNRYTANTIVFTPEFEVIPEAVEIASHPTLLE